MKLAVVSLVFPPSVSGQSMVLRRILGGWDGRDYCLLSVKDYAASADEFTEAKLPAAYHALPAAPLGNALNWPVLRYAKNAANAAMGLVTRAAAIRRVVDTAHCDAVMACTGDPLDLPAAYLAARWLDLPFYPYVFDDFATQFVRGVYRAFARFWQPVLLRGASRVIVPNEFLRDQYRRDYGIDSTVVHNPVDAVPDAELARRAAAPWPTRPGELSIRYTGSVYDAHYDALHNLLAGLDQLVRPGDVPAVLDLYTSMLRADLTGAGGLRGRVRIHGAVPPADALTLQREADVLLLPLAFDSPYPDLVRTSAPGKIGEYLCSGRPVLVHAPADTFVAWYFKTHDCGVVVDRKDPAAVADAVRGLAGDAEMRHRLVANAMARARADFWTDQARREFRRAITPLP